MAAFVISITPTNRHEILGGIQFRVYEGKTNTGIPLEMLGLFRVTDIDKRDEFERTVCMVAVGDPAPGKLLSSHGLIVP